MYNHVKGLPFTSEYDYRYIREIRHLRNLTINEFSTYMQVDTGTISKLENKQVPFSIHYESKFKEAIEELKISNLELLSVEKVIELKALREGGK
ncbi:helix-turn-helix domain-containing protein [Peribacillus frigoritolerans]|uniref:helix-turn-helix domain-containing protein n=1 Tax=Peribacillus frigoritolerans TaxID=450367 RepID=UPI0022824005|nr:helix-turn-helix transcriptional regulator [Peribacillus frigoritolerans]MCY8938083.1 helix-turn-helix domain-containing protein [Peribacillus frigoritolerans]